MFGPVSRGFEAACAMALSCTLGACAAVSGLDHYQGGCTTGWCDDGSPIGPSSSEAGELANAAEDLRDAAEDPSSASVMDGANDWRPTGTGSDGSRDEAQPASGADARSPAADGSDGGVSSAEASTCSFSLSDPDHCGSCDTRCDSCGGLRACVNGHCVGGTVYFYEAFSDNARGWALDPTWTIAPECSNPPAPQRGFPDPTSDHTPSTSDGGGVVGAYVCGNNPAGQTNAFRYATSPAVDVSAAPTLKLTFYRWLNIDRSTWMLATLDVFDGSTWVNVFTNGSTSTMTDSAWSRVEYDVTAYKNTAFRVRFGYSVLSPQAYVMSCWNVDDVTLSSASCP
jgi:hypothetical protein